MSARTVVVAFGLLAAAAIAVAVARRPHRSAVVALHVDRAVDISAAPGPQSETAVAVDPRRPAVAVAGSNDLAAKAMRVYSTVDGGRIWTSAHLPLPPVADICETSDPSVAIGADGTQYFSFLGLHCRDGRIRGASVYIARRSSAGARWRTLPLPVSSGRRFTLADDRPSITADLGADSPHRGRLYVAWSRFSFDASAIWADPDEEQVSFVNVVALSSHSDDGGHTWSKPVVLSEVGSPLEVRLAVGRGGVVYAVWRDAKTDSIYLARSTDGNTFEAPQFVASAVVPRGHSCHTFRARIPAQPKRCVSPNPVVAADAADGPRTGSVYVIWGTTGLNGSQDVEIASFKSDLTPQLGVGRVQLVNPAERMHGLDQFLPTAAVDRTGRLWSCYYQTLRPAGVRARFTCTVSMDGGRTWAHPVAATRRASDESRRPANVANGYGDYEAVAPDGNGLLTTWTDGSSLRSRREEIDAARITLAAAER